MASQTFPPILQGEPHRPKGDLISENLVRQTKLSVRQYSSGQGVWLNKAINWERRSNSHLGSRMGGGILGGREGVNGKTPPCSPKSPWASHQCALIASCKLQAGTRRPAVSFLVSSPPKTGGKKKKYFGGTHAGNSKFRWGIRAVPAGTACPHHTAEH